MLTNAQSEGNQEETEMTGYAIGAKVWLHGDEYTIIGEPYNIFDGMMQHARGMGGKVVAVPTPEQKAADLAERKQERADMQAGFARLKKLTATN